MPIVCRPRLSAVSRRADRREFRTRHTPKTTDFVNEAATSDMFEIQASKLAAGRTTGDVQAFANQMVADHTKTTSDLTGLAQTAKLFSRLNC
jgi:predicted outer membrane protein